MEIIDILWKEVIFYEYFEILGPLYKPYDYTSKRINFKHKYNKALKLIALHSHKNQSVMLCGQKCKISTHFYHLRGSSIYVIDPIR
jgi:hypothetical protein